MDTLNGAFRPDPKPRKRIVDKKFISFIMTKECMYCDDGTPADEPHHDRKGHGDGQGCMSRKPDDYRLVRTCWRCHRALEGNDKKRLEWMNQKIGREDIYLDQLNNVIEYLAG